MMDKRSATKKLYLEDPYTVSFQAELVTCKKLPEGRIVAVLDRTFFYPESGGQLHDRGEIEGVEVVDVREDAGGSVYHEVTKELPPGTVRCRVDWDRRFDHMQQHTGQHVLSRAFIEVGNLETVSFHMGDDACTIDVAGAELDEEKCEAAEALANTVVWQDRAVTVRTVPRADVDEAALRKEVPEGVEAVRLVEIDGFDVIGCCGTHVKRCGELGMIKILKHEKSKGAFRVSFKVGRRALRDFREKHEIITRLANRFTTSVEGLGEKIEKLRLEAQKHRKDLQKLSKRLATFEAQNLLETAREHRARRYVVAVLAGCDEDYLKLLSAELKSGEHTISMIASEGGSVICSASKDVDVDFSSAVIERARSMGGSGGGRGGFAAVRLPEKAAVADFLERAYDEITSP